MMRPIVLSSLVSLNLMAVSSFGFELSCISDYRAVDGGLVQVDLKFGKDGRGTATIVEQADSPATSHSEKTVLRALECKDNSSAGFLSIDCKGPFTVNVSEMELVGNPNGPEGFSRRVIIATSFDDKNYSFGHKSNGPTKEGCTRK